MRSNKKIREMNEEQRVACQRCGKLLGWCTRAIFCSQACKQADYRNRKSVTVGAGSNRNRG